MGDKKAALKSALEAVEIRRQLADKHPDAYLPDLAASLNNLGNIQSDLGDKEAALKSALEAFECYWPFFEKYPQAFIQNIIIVIQNILKFSEELEKKIDDLDEEVLKRMTIIMDFVKKIQDREE